MNAAEQTPEAILETIPEPRLLRAQLSETLRRAQAIRLLIRVAEQVHQPDSESRHKGGHTHE